MNRFRTKRRAKDDSAAGRTSEDSEHSTTKPSFKSFRRGKKAQHEEPKKELDIATALPSNDDFRTSLLMTNLSARFSMLREQDDPNTKIGKASDDSVLFPKRQSRMADFGYGSGSGLGLSDIAEVESIKAPFMRSGSFASDDAGSTNSGSVMSRPKPAEGNNLFGGRQKIYKIPAGSSSKAVGLAGRVVYDDDVALSAFQRWRLAEKDRTYDDGEQEDSSADAEADQARSESPPPVGYNRNRETTSTTSSASFRARNSTAATSFVSQPTPSVKDWQSVSTAPTSASSTPALERNVTRTRRLYEQASSPEITQESSSVMSRIDAFNRQKPFGSRTPDLSTNSPSPTTGAFTDRLAVDKRSILTKASAPNLRTTSPPTTGSSVGTMDLGIKVPTQADSKINFGGAPPLSPPISETGENPILPIQPNDLGKATALGVFHKPSQPYDESIYAQRQIQLQQGRETPTQRLRAGSSASHATDRSRSASSTHRQPFEAKLEPIKTQPSVQEEAYQTSFLHDLDSPDSATDAMSVLPVIAPVSVQRPADTEHPALRQSALPTPLSVVTASSNEPSPISENRNTSVEKLEQRSPEEEQSPTLGQAAGLSGMVRQHLRSTSNASSIYSGAPTPGFDSSLLMNQIQPPQLPDDVLGKSNPWGSPEQDWTMSFYGGGVNRDGGLGQNRDSAADSKPSGRSSNDVDNESDEFANQLAEARRRVRERLTSYVESDSSRPASPSPQLEPTKENMIPIPPNPLGILRPKSSRGSLMDRSRSIVAGQSKAMKMLGLGSSSRGNSPGPSKPLSDDKDASPLETMEEIPKEEEPQELTSNGNTEREAERPSVDVQEDDGNTHPGLRAFRQARKELQRRQELEKLAQQQVMQTMQHQDQPTDHFPMMQSPPKGERRQRTPSRERKPPPVLYRQRAPSDERSYGVNSNPPSARGSSEGERSGSQTRDGRSTSNIRPPRVRNNTGPQEAHLGPINPSRPPMLRSPGLPGLPGTDIRRSPIMPPQGYPGRGLPSPAPSPHVLDRSRSTGNLAIHPTRPPYESHSSQPSPISPFPGANGLPASPSPFAGSPATTPTTLGPRPRKPSAPQSPGFPTSTSTLNESMKRVVDKRDISEPTFVMSTSRVPTVNLPHPHTNTELNSGAQSRSGSRSRSSSRGGTGPAPPVPPINPRRRRETARPGPGYDDDLSAPQLPYANQTNNMASEYSDDNRSAFSISDDEEGKGDQRRRLRKGHTDGQGFGGRVFGKMRDNSPPFVAKGPPASRAVVTTTGPKANHGMNVPGGMF